MRNSKMYALRLHTVNDEDIITALDAKENKQAFIKHCIRREINNDNIKTVTEGNGKSREDTY